MIRIISFRPFNNDTGAVKAFFDIEYEGIIIKGFRLINGSRGLFIKGPEERGKDDKYYPILSFIDSSIKDQIEEQAKNKYEKKGE